MFALFCVPWAANAQETVTVCDGTTTNSKIPVNGLYTDTQGTTSEFIIPADSLEVMEGGTISKVTFYISEIPDTWGSPVIQLYLGEVDGTTLSSLYGPSNFTVVKTMVWSNQQSTIEVEFDEPYTYEGGNLLIGTYVQTKSSYKTTNFYGVSGEDGCSRYNNGSGAGTSQNFLPKTTFVYEPAQSGGDVCEKPATLVAEDVTGNSATLTWTGGSGVYNIELNGTIIEQSYQGYTYDLRDLAATTAYTVKVQSVCNGETPTSTWKSVSFTTPCATYDIPYTYDFEEEAPFACWTPIAGVTRANSSSNAHDGSYYLRFAGSTSNLVALPQFNEPTNNLRVEFWTRPEGYTYSSCGTFSVGYMTDITDASTFVEVENYAYNEWTSNTHVKKTVDFNNAPANANIAFRHNSGSTSYYWFADDVTVKEIPSCLAPTGLAANVSTTSAELSWTANSGETAWTVYYKKSTDESYTEVANVTANPYTLSGLDASSNYEFYVVANCAADDASEASDVFTFATECDVIAALGYSESFDNYAAGNNVLPICWSYINTTTNSTYAAYPRILSNGSYSTYSNTAPNCLYFYSYGSSDPQPQYAILPEMTGLAGLQVTLMAKGYNTSSTFKIGTMSDPADTNTFTMIAEQTLTTSYPTDPFEYLIPADCRDSYLAIMMDAAPSGYNTRGVYVDDIVIREAPTCLKPTELAVTGVSTTTATLDWIAGADETAWQIMLNDDEDNLIMATDNQWDIEGLTAATAYTAKVRAYCSEADQSEWSNEVNFATLCEAITTFPWTENFDSLTAGIPDCWDNSEGTTTALNYMWNYYASGHEGAGLRFNSYNNSNGLTNFLKTVSLSLPSDQLMQLSFWYKNPTGGDFSVYISTDGGATHETSLATGLTGVTTWTEHPAISLADYAGQEVVIVFKGTSNYGSGDAYIYLDDVTVMEVPTCLKPNGLEVTATTTTTATLNWTVNGNETAWQIMLNDDEDNLIMATDNQWDIEDLAASTAYTAKVRAYCSEDDQSDWSNEVSFATACEYIVVDAANPFTEGFEGTWPPLCWESIPVMVNGNQYKWQFTNSQSYNGSQAAYSNYYGPILLMMPELQLGTDGDAAQLTFWSYNSFVNAYGKNSVVLLDGDDEIELWSPESVINDWEEVTIDLTQYMGQNISLAFKYEGNNAHGWYIDDVNVEVVAASSCAKILVDEANPEWSEDFEDDAAGITTPYTGILPACWSVPVEYTSAEGDVTPPQVYYKPDFNATENGSYSLRMRYRSMLAMPELDENVDFEHLKMGLYVRQSFWSYKLEIGVITDIDNPDESYHMVATVNNSDKNVNYFECNFASVKDLVGEGRYIVFKNVGGSEGDLYSNNYLDDITLTYVEMNDPLCEVDPDAYIEDFETYAVGSEPKCWEVIMEDVTLDSETRPQVYGNFNTTAGGSKTLRLKNRCVYAMPECSDPYPIGGMSMTFNLRQPKSIYRLQVGVVDEQGNFTVVKTFKCSSTEMEAKEVNFQGYTGRVAFRNTLVPGTGRSTDYLDYSINYIDDIDFIMLEDEKMDAGAESFDTNADLESIEVYPNPTTGNLYIDAMNIQKVECYNQMGQLVRVYDNVRNSIDLNNLSEGVYTLRITVPQGVTVRKVVKR